jgi:glycine cleavage system H protein
MKSYPLIPEEERKCVWMATGFISYKLCDRSYQCETCPFDQAIRNEDLSENDLGTPRGEVSPSENNGMEGALKSDSSTRINGSIFYHPDHCWAQVENPENVKVGIDDLLAQLMMNVKVVILPQAGSFYGQGECFAHIIRDDYILPVIFPLSGSVQTVNPRLKKEPELIITDPRGDGWLITIKPGNLENDLKKLLFGRQALLWYQQEEKGILSRVDSMPKHNPGSLGLTMQDGGVRIDGLADMLRIVSSEQRAELLDFSIRRAQSSKGFLSKKRDSTILHPIPRRGTSF